MTIDQTIKQSRLEAELLSKGYSLEDIYGKPDHFVGARKFGRKFLANFCKVVFFVVLLYGVWASLMSLNTAVQTGNLQARDIPVISTLKAKYDSVSYETRNLNNGYDDIERSSENQSDFNLDNQQSNPLFEKLKDTTSQFEGFMGIADDMVSDIQY